MRISDWSSDVCSSDLANEVRGLSGDSTPTQPSRPPLGSSGGRTCGRDPIEGEGSKAEVTIPFDDIIVAVGRKARLTGYGLEELGIATDRTVVTNDYLETLYPNIFAAGDVAGPYQFTHRSDEHTSELQSPLRHSYAVFC